MCRPTFRSVVILGLLLVCGAAAAKDGGGRGEGRGGPRAPKGPPREAAVFHTEVPEHGGSVVAGRPTAGSVTLSLVLSSDAEALLVWGTDPGKFPATGKKLSLKAGVPVQAVISGLAPDKEYYYALLDASARARLLPEDSPDSFHTARPPGGAFTFTVQADPHLDGAVSPELYRSVLLSALAEKPDFHIDLGDTFMTEKHAARASAAAQYAAQHYYFGLIGGSAPVFLVLGNHDGEAQGRREEEGADSLRLWSHKMRTKYFANPVPDGFYSGNGSPYPGAGLLQNYYAWTWGDALFVVLDPYWTSAKTRGGSEPWNMTLGKAQYDWLAKTLKTSKSKFKFVFIHQLTGGLGSGGRRGLEAAPLYEWGGHEPDGSYTFDENRPGWGKPIHKILVESGVNIVFHGHDHFFARQELDGVVYQLVPQPAERNPRGDHAEEYGYEKGDFLPKSGHLRVRVSTTEVVVDYIRAAGQNIDGKEILNGQSAYSYNIHKVAKE